MPAMTRHMSCHAYGAAATAVRPASCLLRFVGAITSTAAPSLKEPPQLLLSCHNAAKRRCLRCHAAMTLPRYRRHGLPMLTSSEPLIPKAPEHRHAMSPTRRLRSSVMLPRRRLRVMPSGAAMTFITLHAPRAIDAAPERYATTTDEEHESPIVLLCGLSLFKWRNQARQPLFMTTDIQPPVTANHSPYAPTIRLCIACR